MLLARASVVESLVPRRPALPYVEAAATSQNTVSAQARDLVVR